MRLIWKKEANGRFTVKSYCHVVTDYHGINKTFWRMVWFGNAPPMVEIFIWQMMHGKIPVKVVLLQRGLISDQLAHCPLCQSCAETVKRVKVTWVAPPSGSLKFNADGSSLGKPGSADIGGVLRNDKGEILLMFSKPIGTAESNLAKLLAIKEALSLFSCSKWKGSFSLIIETDSQNATRWVRAERESRGSFFTTISTSVC